MRWGDNWKHMQTFQGKSSKDTGVQTQNNRIVHELITNWNGPQTQYNVDIATKGKRDRQESEGICIHQNSTGHQLTADFNVSSVLCETTACKYSKTNSTIRLFPDDEATCVLTYHARHQVQTKPMQLVTQIIKICQLHWKAWRLHTRESFLTRMRRFSQKR
jgi:hypothetical protein